MPKQVRLRRGTTSQHSAFTGADGEVTLDTTKRCLVIHDGVTAGGKPVDGFLKLTPTTPLTAQTINGIINIIGGDSESYGLSVTNQAGFNQVLISADLQLSRLIITQEFLNWASSIHLNLSSNHNGKRITLAGNTTFTSSGYLFGARLEAFIDCDASNRTLTWPAAWKWLNATPTSIAANKSAILDLRCKGTTEADVRAEWHVQP